MTPEDFKALGQTLAAAFQAKRPGRSGRQSDSRSQIKYHGLLVIPLFEDRGVVCTPDLVAAGNLEDPRDGFFEVHETVTIRGGQVGGRQNVKPLGGQGGNLLNVLGALAPLLGGPAGAVVGAAAGSPLAPPPPLPEDVDPEVARILALLRLLRSGAK